jgi:hypothetical protein
VLVAGTLIYGHGDDRHEHHEKGQHDAEGHARIREHLKAPVFKFMYTITAYPTRNIHRRRWHRAVDAVRAAARLRLDVEHGQEGNASGQHSA